MSDESLKPRSHVTLLYNLHVKEPVGPFGEEKFTNFCYILLTIIYITTNKKLNLWHLQVVNTSD